MAPIKELELLLTLIRKYDLPLSPILEYAISEKKEENASNLSIEDDEGDSAGGSSEQVAGDEPKDCVRVVDFDIPENADTTTRNKYLMQFCYRILSDYKNALTDREKDICNMLLVENARRRASEEYRLTEERVRQIFVKSINKISLAHESAMHELEALRKENEELKRKNYLLEKEMTNSSNIDNVLSIQELENSLCNNAKRLLAHPNECFPFSNRTANVLRAANVMYFREIPQLTFEQVKRFRNCGRKTIAELKDFMSKYSLDFGMTYESIISHLSKYVDEDFESSIFVRKDMHKLTQKEAVAVESKPESVVEEESATVELTRDLIEMARTPNGGFTKSQLSALGVSWPAPQDWIEEVVGTYITPWQLEAFNHIDYVVKKPSIASSSYFTRGMKTYKDIAFDKMDLTRLSVVLNAMEYFEVPATPRDVARTVDRSNWVGSLNEDVIDTILKRLPEVEYVPWGKYILKSKKK